MSRLTTNKAISEMNVIELAHNSCYGKDGNARYRDFETDIDARELTIKLLEQYADIPNEFTCNDDFDDFMADSLQYGTDDMLGLIAVFYRNLWAMANLRGRLKEYEDLEEQGKLLKLPCKVGDRIYRIAIDEELEHREVEIRNIENITIIPDGRILFKSDPYDDVICELENIVTNKPYLDCYIVFLSLEEAESALREMKEAKAALREIEEAESALREMEEKKAYEKEKEQPETK